MYRFKQFLTEAEGKGLTIFDIDETLFFTKAKIIVRKGNDVVKSLTNQEYNSYKLQPGEEFDFAQFKDGQFFRQTSVPNHLVLQRIPYIMNNIQGRNSRVILLTAREKPTTPKKHKEFEKLLRKTFMDYGVNTKGIDIVMVGGSENKKPFVRQLQKQLNFDRLRLYDDHEKNLQDFLSLQGEFPSAKFTAYKVNHGGKFSVYKG